MANKTQQKTKYPGVYKDLKSGKFFYQIELGIDKATGKRIRRKKSTDRFGNNFSTALQAHKEVTRIGREYQVLSLSYEISGVYVVIIHPILSVICRTLDIQL